MDRNVQFMSSRFIMVPCNQQLQYLFFLRRQLCVRKFRRGKTAKQLDHSAGDVRRHRCTTVQDASHGLHDAFRGRIFQKISVRPGAQCLKDLVVLVMDGQHQYRQSRKPSPKLSCALDPVHLWKPDVRHDKIDGGRVDLIQSSFHSSKAARTLQPRRQSDQLTKPFTKLPLIFDYRYAR